MCSQVAWMLGNISAAIAQKSLSPATAACRPGPFTCRLNRGAEAGEMHRLRTEP